MANIDFTKFSISAEGRFTRKAESNDKYELAKQRVRETNRKLYYTNENARMRKRTLALALRMHYKTNVIKPETLLYFTPYLITYAADIAAMLERVRLRAVAVSEEPHKCHDDA
jgi:hypothetical protein